MTDKSRITDEEFEALVTELSERHRGLVFMNGRSMVRKGLDLIRYEILTRSSDSTIDFTYTIHMVYGDLQEIVGRLRLKKLEHS
jgi:hypothetical protein